MQYLKLKHIKYFTVEKHSDTIHPIILTKTNPRSVYALKASKSMIIVKSNEPPLPLQKTSWPWLDEKSKIITLDYMIDFH